ncbi:MAG: hypothetical protein ACRDLV_16115, partial [Solirubrobacteraceae bacterium]
VQQVAGDVPVILRDVESGNVSGLVSVGIELVADAVDAVNRVTISHGAQAAAPEPTAVPEPPAPAD